MASTAHSSTEPAEYDDTGVRRRIGPWTDEGVPDLSAFEPDTTFFVRAAAGSGKTTALVARMVALVRSTAVSVDDMAAITFTRKAAGEMNARFVRELRKARRAVPDDSSDADSLDRALARAQRTFIGTIHSFCTRLLREYALVAGIPPDFRAGMEDRDEREFRERAWQQYLRSVRSDDPGQFEQMSRLGLDPSDLQATFETFCRYPELDPYVEGPDRSPDLDGAVETVRRRLEQWQALRPEGLPKGRDDVMRAFDKAEKMIQYEALDEPAQKAGFLSLFDDLIRDGSVPNRSCKVTYWGGSKTAAKKLRDEGLPRLVKDVIRPVLRPWRAYVHERVVSFVRPAVDTYRELRRDEGQLTFHDLLLWTRTLLRDHPDVRRQVQEEYPRLLVDEFQDTDPLQAEILFYLASRDPTETDWRACHPRPGSLFVVGDDKQSIYRFRRADKEVFDEVGELIDEAGGEAVDLTKNFRSVPTICDWCDRAFRDLFEDEEDQPLQANYVPFDPQRAATRRDTAIRRIEIEKVSWNRGAEIARTDAGQIARFIRGAVAGRLDEAFYGEAEGAVFSAGADYSDFLILTRKKARLSIYAETLAEYEIPYTVTGSEDLGDSDALKALVDLMTCALRPDDPVACVAYLKGSLVGCSDDDLYQYRRAGGRFDRVAEPVPKEVRDGIADERWKRMGNAFRRLRRARDVLRSERPAVAVRKIVDESGLLAGAAHPHPEDDGPDASLRAGAVLRILTVVQSLSAQGRDWVEVLDELQRIVDGEDSVDSLTLEAGGDRAVRLMNVHQAKGLEAPVVFLADPYSAGGGNQAVTRHVRRETEELVAPVVQGTEYYQQVTHAPLGWHDESDHAFRALEERHEAAEEHRLLYVAATRARNMLVVSTYPEKPESGPWAPLYPYLGAADVPVLDPPDVAPSDAPERRAPHLASARGEREKTLEIHGRPSYRTQSVTNGKRAERPGIGSADGYGAAVGRAVHRLIEHCVDERDTITSIPRAAALQVLRSEEEDAPEDRAAPVQRMVNGFLNHSLWREIKDAPTAHAEYPLAQFQNMSEPTLLRGTVDLVYRREGGWGLLDLKTDRTNSEAISGLPRNHPYVRQVRAYVKLWQDITGESVTRAGLWWAHLERFTAVVSASGSSPC